MKFVVKAIILVQSAFAFHPLIGIVDGYQNVFSFCVPAYEFD
jgi:hypothetical protein